jgi:hypothetical protein
MKQDPPDPGLDARLTEALSRLPDAPVPSNFTARVMQAIDLEEARAPRPWLSRWNWHSLLPRVAVAMVAIVAGIGVYEHQLSTQRHRMAASVAMIASQPVPSVDALKNFDAIQRMSQPVHADDELLILMQ